LWYLHPDKSRINALQTAAFWTVPYQSSTKKWDGAHPTIALKDAEAPLKIIPGNLRRQKELMHPENLRCIRQVLLQAELALKTWNGVQG